MRPHKYRAKRTTCIHGHDHPSAKEARRCGELHLLARAGQITGLEVEPRFTFIINGEPVKMRNGRAASYRPDFCYVENGVKVCEDTKSTATDTEAFSLRLALARHLWPSIEWRIT